MSRGDDGNPSDDAMDADAARDVPAAIGSLRHAPKLSRESRAINPRALLAAEAAAQSGDPDYEPDYEMRVHPEARRARHAPPPPADPYAHAWAPPPNVEPRPREHSTLPRGMPRVVPPPPAPPVRPPLFGTALTSARELEERQAWDAYAAAALQSAIISAGGVFLEEQTQIAAAVADTLLAERRERFG